MLVIAITNNGAESLFISQKQEDGTWVRENHSDDFSYWSRREGLTYEEVIAYHMEWRDTILHDEVAGR